MLINIHTHHSIDPKQEILDCVHIHQDGYYSYGIMHNKSNITRNTEKNDVISDLEIEQILTHKNCVAIGEIGLDKTLSISLEKQKELFINQIYTSEKFKLPIIIHCVKSWNEILAIRKEIKPKQIWIFHGFRKTALTDSVLHSGVYISIGTAILTDNKLQNCLKNIPLQRLFLETDNETNYSIEDVYQKVASIKNISLSTLEKQIEINAINTFKKWEIG